LTCRQVKVTALPPPLATVARFVLLQGVNEDDNPQGNWEVITFWTVCVCDGVMGSAITHAVR